MRLRQLSDLINDVRLRADIVNAQTFLSDAQVTEFFNQGWARIYGTLTETGEDYYTVPFLWSTVPNQDTYYTTADTGAPAGSNLLPTDMYRVRGLDAQVVQVPDYTPCERYEFERRCDWPTYGTAWPHTPRYAYIGSGNVASIRLRPALPSTTPMRLWYYPSAVRLVANTDTIDGGNGWEIYAIDWAARRCAEHDENYELAQRLDQSMAEMEASIRREAANRISGQAKKVRRVRSRYGGGYGTPWGRGGGGL